MALLDDKKTGGLKILAAQQSAVKPSPTAQSAGGGLSALAQQQKITAASPVSRLTSPAKSGGLSALMQQEKAPQESPSLGSVIGNNLLSGAFKVTHAPARIISNNFMPDEPTGGAIDAYIRKELALADAQHEKTAALNEQINTDTLGGKALKNVIAPLTQSAPGMAQDVALIAASAPVKAGQLGYQAVNAAANAIKNPAFASRVTRYFADAQDNALKEGATPEQALRAGLMESIPSALIEGAGGMDTLVKDVATKSFKTGAGQFLKDVFIKAGGEEALEEVTQGIVQQLSKGATYKPDMPFFSTEQEAVINPADLAQAAGVGYAGGVLFGGGARVGGALSQLANQPMPLAQPMQETTNKNKSLSQLPASGLQLPGVEATSDPMYSIANSPQDVNKKQSSKLWMQDPQNNAQDAFADTANNSLAQPATNVNMQAPTSPIIDRGPVLPQPTALDAMGAESPTLPAFAPSGEQAISRVRSNTLENSGIFNDVEKQMEGLRPEDMTYDVVTERESMARAQQRLAQDTAGEMVALPQKEAWSGDDLDTAMGILYRVRKEAEQTGDYGEVVKWSQMVRQHGTKAGQFIQAFAKYTRTPEGVLVRAADSLARANLPEAKINKVMADMTDLAQTLDDVKNHNVDALVDLIKRQAEVRGNKVSKITENSLRAQGDDIQWLYNFALTQLEDIATDYNRVSAGKKLSTYQVLSHLWNLKTTNRNFVSNQTFDIVDSAAQNVGMIPDAILGMFTGQRTVGLNKSWLSRAKREGAIKGMQRAWAEVALDVDASKAESKYGTGARRTFKAKDSKVPIANMSNVEKSLGFALNVTDEFHKGSVRAEIAESLQPFVDRGALSAEQAAEFAEQDALFRSFQDHTKVATILGAIKDGLNLFGVGDSGKRLGKAGKFGGFKIKEFGLGDFVQKYIVVPGALATRSVEFSATGYYKAITAIGMAAKERNLSPQLQRQMALGISRAVTGTGLITAFAALTRAGLLFFLDDEKDKNAAALYRAAGLSGAQLNVSGVARWLDGDSPDKQNGDTLISVEFLEPLNALMHVGALIAKSEKSGFKNMVVQSANGVFDAFLEMPTMQTMTSMWNAIQYHDEESGLPLISEVGIELARSSLSGFIPGPVRQVGQALDPVYRDTSGDTDTEQLIRGLQGSIPGLREQLPEKLTGLGEVQTAGDNTAVNVLNSMVSPGKVSTYQETPVTNELMRLYKETGSGSVLPRRNAPNQFTEDGKKYEMDKDAKREFLKTSGQTLNQALSDMLKSPEYKRATPEEKVKMISNLKTYANDTAKAEYLKTQGVSYSGDEWVEQVPGLEKVGISDGVAVLLKTALSSMKTDKEKNAYLDGVSWLSPKQTAALKAAFVKGNDVDYSSEESIYLSALSDAGRERWPQAQAAGMSADWYAKLYPVASTSNLKEAEKIAQLRAATGWSNQQAEAFYKLVNGR